MTAPYKDDQKGKLGKYEIAWHFPDTDGARLQASDEVHEKLFEINR